jgi:hypothetical protein
MEDPFNLFPLQTVSAQLSKLVDRSESALADRAGWYGVSSKYRSIEDEHDLEVVQLLAGAAFVLGQAAIVEAISIATKIRELAGDPPWLPRDKSGLMRTAASIHAVTRESKITLINAIANYFKHHYEWPATWTGAPPRQQRTIDIVRKFGFSPQYEDNIEIALRGFGLAVNDLQPLATTVQSWREGLAEFIRTRLGAERV